MIMKTSPFKETPQLIAHGKTATKEFSLAKNVDDAIKPKAREFDDLKRDAREKMMAKRDQHLKRAGDELIAARELMRVEQLGSFDAWIKSGAVVGMKGKAISKSQANRLIEGKTSGNVDSTGKRRQTAPTDDSGGRSTPELREFTAPWVGVPKPKAPAEPLPIDEQPDVMAAKAAVYALPFAKWAHVRAWRDAIVR